MKVLVLGSEGYIGWPLYLHLKSRGHMVRGIDNESRALYAIMLGSCSATPSRGEEHLDMHVDKEFQRLRNYIKRLKPDAIVHLAEQPSAPLSMKDLHFCHTTMTNNIIGTINLIYSVKNLRNPPLIVKLGSMGEYGTDDPYICEDNPHQPMNPWSWYHLSKVHDTNNLKFACKLYGLQVADIMQAPVYGLYTPQTMTENRMTRFDFDQYFGTVLNRFCAQATIGHPLTVYGEGNQRRGFIPLIESVECIRRVIEDFPRERGKYTSINQLAEVFSIKELAEMVAKECAEPVDIQYLKNPRYEKENPVYVVESNILKNLGYKPSRTIKEEITYVLLKLTKYRDRILSHKSAIMPTTTWR